MTQPEKQPIRIQLSRAKGWRKPDNTVVVARPSKWGNPFTVSDCRAAGYVGTDDELAARVVSAFSVWLGTHWRENWSGEESEKQRGEILKCLPELRGKNLACWCRIGSSCHADILLELANK